MIRWLIEQANVDTKQIYNDQGKCIVFLLPSDLEACYAFTKVEGFFTNEWAWKFAHTHNRYDILSSWYEKGNVFKSKDINIFPTTIFETT